MVGGFTLLEHTADIGISACGDKLEEALAWLAVGMFSLIVEPSTVVRARTQVITVTSSDRDALAVDWLNELVYQYETTGFLMKDFQVSLNQEVTQLEALCGGETLDPSRHHILTVIKAATYHGLSVNHGQQWQVSVFLDI